MQTTSSGKVSWKSVLVTRKMRLGKNNKRLKNRVPAVAFAPSSVATTMIDLLAGSARENHQGVLQQVLLTLVIGCMCVTDFMYWNRQWIYFRIMHSFSWRLKWWIMTYAEDGSLAQCNELLLCKQRVIVGVEVNRHGAREHEVDAVSDVAFA